MKRRNKKKTGSDEKEGKREIRRGRGIRVWRDARKEGLRSLREEEGKVRRGRKKVEKHLKHFLLLNNTYGTTRVQRKQVYLKYLIIAHDVQCIFFYINYHGQTISKQSFSSNERKGGKRIKE